MATKKADPLDDLENNPGDGRAIALMLWKDRFNNPEMAIQVTADDIKGLDDCTAYLKVTPEVRVFRPKGRPAQEAQPQTAKRSAVPAVPAGPRPDYVLIQLVDKDGNAIKPVENTIEKREMQIEADNIRNAKTQATAVANELLSGLAAGNYSDATIRDAAKLLMLLAKA